MKKFSLYFNLGPSNTIYPNDKYRYNVEINVHISVMLILFIITPFLKIPITITKSAYNLFNPQYSITILSHKTASDCPVTFIVSRPRRSWLTPCIAKCTLRSDCSLDPVSFGMCDLFTSLQK